MPVNQIVITDADQGLHQASSVINSDQLGIPGCEVRVATLAGGVSQGVQTITVTTPKCRFIVLPTRGMNIWKAWAGENQNEELPFGWNSPARGPVHPGLVPLMEPGGLGWLDGFDELMTRCGLESNGAPEFDDDGRLAYPLHGRIANRPARKVMIESNTDTGEISVVGEVEEARFHFLKLRLTARATIKSGTQEIRVEDEVRNLSASPAEFQMLYHINFGDPLLDGGSEVVAPVKTVVPRNDHAASGIDSWQNFPPPQAGTEEQVYFFEMHADQDGQTQTLLKNAHSTAGVAIGYNVKQLPVYTLWKNPTAIEDGYVTGLEPGTNVPNPRTFEGEQGRVVKLAGGATHKLGVRVSMLTSEVEVERVEKQIELLRGGKEPEIFRTPQAGWCADA